MQKEKILPIVAAIVIPVGYSFIVRLLFGMDSTSQLFGIMSIGFLFFLPLLSGVITVFVSSVERAKSGAYCALMPWVPVAIFMAITLATKVEGWACWLMVLPLFMGMSSFGGLVGGLLKLRSKGLRYISVVAILPFLISPIEQAIGPQTSTYTADTYIDIQAPAATIWANVTRVQEIPAEQDKGWLTRNLGFPRPVKAELDFAGVGGSREAIFTNGLVFHEKVTEYVDQKKMVFSIKAFPYEIPSTTMDEHVVIGGEYFDVIDGTYELEQLDATTQRLHLYSHFKLTTTFNFYASVWARWIMQDIQDNILQIEKSRAEGSGK